MVALGRSLPSTPRTMGPCLQNKNKNHNNNYDVYVDFSDSARISLVSVCVDQGALRVK